MRPSTAFQVRWAGWVAEHVLGAVCGMLAADDCYCGELSVRRHGAVAACFNGADLKSTVVDFARGGWSLARSVCFVAGGSCDGLGLWRGRSARVAVAVVGVLGGADGGLRWLALWTTSTGCGST